MNSDIGTYKNIMGKKSLSVWLMLTIFVSLSALVAALLFFYPFDHGLVLVSGDRVTYKPYALRSEMNKTLEDIGSTGGLKRYPVWEKPIHIYIDENSTVGRVCNAVYLLCVELNEIHYHFNEFTISTTGIGEGMQRGVHPNELELSLEFKESDSTCRVILITGNTITQDQVYADIGAIRDLDEIITEVVERYPGVRLGVRMFVDENVMWSRIHGELFKAFEVLRSLRCRGMALMLSEGGCVVFELRDIVRP